MFRNPISWPTQSAAAKVCEVSSACQWHGEAHKPLADRRIGGKNGHNGIIFHGCRSRSTLAGPIEQDRRIDLTVRTYRTGVTSSVRLC